MRPVPIAEELDDELSRLISKHRAGPLDMVHWRRTLNIAKKSLGTDAVIGYQTIGMLSSLVLDRAGVEENYERALKLSGYQNHTLVANYSVSRMFLGDVRGSKSLIEIIKNDLVDPLIVAKLISECTHRCDFENAHFLLQRLKRLDRLDLIEPERANEVRLAFDIVRAAGCSGDDIDQRLELAYATFVKHLGHASMQSNVTLSESIHYCFSSYEEVNLLIDTDWAIADAIVDQFEDSLGSLISFSTTVTSTERL